MASLAALVPLANVHAQELTADQLYPPLGTSQISQILERSAPDFIPKHEVTGLPHHIREAESPGHVGRVYSIPVHVQPKYTIPGGPTIVPQKVVEYDELVGFTTVVINDAEEFEFIRRNFRYAEFLIGNVRFVPPSGAGASETVQIPNTVTIVLDDGSNTDPLELPVVALRGGYYIPEQSLPAHSFELSEAQLDRGAGNTYPNGYTTEFGPNDPNADCNEINPHGTHVEASKSINELIRLAYDTEGRPIFDREEAVHEFGIDYSELPGIANRKDYLDRNLGFVRTMFDGAASQYTVIHITPERFPYGFLFDNVLIARGRATGAGTDATGHGNPENSNYGGGVFIAPFYAGELGDVDPRDMDLGNIDICATAGRYDFQFNGVVFIDNVARQRGGAMYIQATQEFTNYPSLARVTVSNSSFVNNRVEIGDGGAIWSGITGPGTRLHVMQSVFDSNRSTSFGNGGAVYLSGILPFERFSENYFVSNVFYNNTAPNQGGAVFASNHTVSGWVNNSFASNQSGSSIGGGAMFFDFNADIRPATAVARCPAPAQKPDCTRDWGDAFHAHQLVYIPQERDVSARSPVFHNNFFVLNKAGTGESRNENYQIAHPGAALDPEDETLENIFRDTSLREYVEIGAVDILGDEHDDGNVVVFKVTNVNRSLIPYQSLRAQNLSGGNGARGGPDRVLGTLTDNLRPAAESQLLDAGNMAIYDTLTAHPDGVFAVIPTFEPTEIDGPGISIQRNYRWGYTREAEQIVDVYMNANFDDRHFEYVLGVVETTDISEREGIAQLQTAPGTYSRFWRYGLDVVGTLPEYYGSEEAAGADWWYYQRNSYRVLDGQVDIGAYEVRAYTEYKVPEPDGIIYVDDNAPGDVNGVHDGNTWKSAYLVLEDAILRASVDDRVVEIRVAQGENIRLDTRHGLEWQDAFTGEAMPYSPGRPSAQVVTVGDVEWNWLHAFPWANCQCQDTHNPCPDTEIQIPFALDMRDKDRRFTEYPVPSYFTRDRLAEMAATYDPASQSFSPYERTYLRARTPVEPHKYMRMIGVFYKMESPSLDPDENSFLAAVKCPHIDAPTKPATGQWRHYRNARWNWWVSPYANIHASIIASVDGAYLSYDGTWLDMDMEVLDFAGNRQVRLGNPNIFFGSDPIYGNHPFPALSNNPAGPWPSLLAQSHNQWYRYNLDPVGYIPYSWNAQGLGPAGSAAASEARRGVAIRGGYVGWRLKSDIDWDYGVLRPWKTRDCDSRPNWGCTLNQYGVFNNPPQRPDPWKRNPLGLQQWHGPDLARFIHAYNRVWAPWTEESGTVRNLIDQPRELVDDFDDAPAYLQAVLGLADASDTQIIGLETVLSGDLGTVAMAGLSGVHSQRIIHTVSDVYSRVDGFTITHADATVDGLRGNQPVVMDAQEHVYVVKTDYYKNPLADLPIQRMGDVSFVAPPFGVGAGLFVGMTRFFDNSGVVPPSIHGNEERAELLLVDSSVVENKAFYGAGVYLDSAYLHVDVLAEPVYRTLIAENHAIYGGGGIFVAGGYPTAIGGDRRTLHGYEGQLADLAGYPGVAQRIVEWMVGLDSSAGDPYDYSGEYDERIITPAFEILTHTGTRDDDPHRALWDLLDNRRTINGIPAYGSITHIYNTSVKYNYASNQVLSEPSARYALDTYGGGLAAEQNALLDVFNANVLGNVAGYGAGFDLDNVHDAQIQNSLIAANWAQTAGGGFYLQNRFTKMDLFNFNICATLIVGNRAAPGNQHGSFETHMHRPRGGGIYSYNSQAMIKHSTIYENTAPEGPAWVDDVMPILQTGSNLTPGGIRDGGNRPAPIIPRLWVVNSIIMKNQWFAEGGRVPVFDPIPQFSGVIRFDDPWHPFSDPDHPFYKHVGNSDDPYDPEIWSWFQAHHNPPNSVYWSMVEVDDLEYYGDVEFGPTVIVGDPQFNTTNALRGPRGFYFADWHNVGPPTAAPNLAPLADYYHRINMGKGDDRIFGTKYDTNREDTDYGMPELGLGFRVTGGPALDGTVDDFGNMPRHMGLYGTAYMQDREELDDDHLGTRWWEERIHFEVYPLYGDRYLAAGLGMDVWLRGEENWGDFFYSADHGWMYFAGELGSGFVVYSISEEQWYFFHDLLSDEDQVAIPIPFAGP